MALIGNAVPGEQFYKNVKEKLRNTVHEEKRTLLCLVFTARLIPSLLVLIRIICFMCGVLFLYGLGYTRQPPFQGNLRERLYEKTWSLLADSREGFSL